jgi:mutator protein MutT
VRRTKHNKKETVKDRASRPALIQVAAGLICQEGRYLITRRKSGVHLGGLWEFPGGKREAGETLEDCLRRELREELSITVTDPVHFRTIRHEYPERMVELHFFRCTIAEGQVRAVDCAEVRWIAPEEFGRFAFPPADRPVLEALLRRQSEGSKS